MKFLMVLKDHRTFTTEVCKLKNIYRPKLKADSLEICDGSVGNVLTKIYSNFLIGI